MAKGLSSRQIPAVLGLSWKKTAIESVRSDESHKKPPASKEAGGSISETIHP